jgi:hypothetical protein
MLFFRRTIQRMLDENAVWLTPEQTQAHVDALNDMGRENTLSTVWEIAVLNALRKFTDLAHEPDLGCRPDIFFGVGEELVAADIVTISDKTRHKMNPIDRLEQELFRRLGHLQETGVKGGFYLSVGDTAQRRVTKERQPPSLLLLHVDEFKTVIFTPEFNRFVAAIKSQPTQRHVYLINSPKCRLEIGFAPGSSGWTINRAVYTQATMLKRNVLWNALDDKADQLGKATVAAHRGIIVCDGDCDVLDDKGDFDKYGAAEIVGAFLEERRSIEFVLVLVPRHKGFGLALSPENYYLHANLYQRGSEVPSWLEPIWKLASAVPQVRRNAMQARYELEFRRRAKKWHEGSTHAGGMTVTRDKIRISARALLELLAGALPQGEFAEMHHLSRENPFLQKLVHGQLLTGMRVEKDIADADDDWVVFEYGSPDPAASRFVAAKRSAGSKE